jgi:glycosyltransferase involved in cell wall biosynthesis
VKSDKREFKIGFDAKRLFNNSTGLGNYSRTLVKNIQKFYPENEYHLFTDKLSLNEITEDFRNGPFKVHVSDAFLGSFWRTFGVNKLINGLNLDIYHGLSHEIPFGINPRTKTLVTFHDLIYEVNPTHFNILDRKLYRLKYKSSARRADHIIAISEETESDLKKIYRIKPDKISVLYQSLNDSFITQPIVPQSRDYFLFVGSIIERKGLQFIIEAYNKLPEEKRKKSLVIGSGRYKSFCLDLINEYKLNDYFEFYDKVDNQEISQYYDHCIALLLPSMKEGFGIPIIESLFRQRPVITTVNSAMSVAAGPGGIVIEKGNVDQLTAALIKIQEQEVNEKLSSEGYSYEKEMFDPQKLSARLMCIYLNILEGPNRS